jgi:ribosomal protein L9
VVRNFWFNHQHRHRWGFGESRSIYRQKIHHFGIVKRTGKYNATVRLHRDVIVDLPYEIVAEK